MRIVVNAFALPVVLTALLLPLQVLPARAEEGPVQPGVEPAVEVVEPAEPIVVEEKPRQWGAEQWVPSLAVISGVTVQNWEATVLAELTSIPPAGSPEPAFSGFLRPPQRARTRDVTPFVGGNFELMTPELPIRTSPRLFFGFELAAAFSTERKVALEGDPRVLASPIPLQAQGSAPYTAATALGQGSQTVARMTNSFWGAHLGVAFPVQLLGRSLRIKPSVAWLRHKINVDGLVVEAQCPDITRGNVPNPDFPPPPRVFPLTKGGCDAGDPSDPRTNFEGFARGDALGIRMAGDATKRFDSIGPGLDVEMDAFRVGPLVASIFASGRIYSVLGPRSVRIRGMLQSPTNSNPLAQLAGALEPQPGFGTPLPPGLVDCSDPTANPSFCTPFVAFPNYDTVSSEFGFEVDQWMYRVGLGLRFSWVGWH